MGLETEVRDIENIAASVLQKVQGILMHSHFDFLAFKCSLLHSLATCNRINIIHFCTQYCSRENHVSENMFRKAALIHVKSLETSLTNKRILRSFGG